MEAEERWPDAPPFIEDAADTTAGGAIGLMNAAGIDGEVQACLRELAERLTRRGWAGQIGGASPVHPPDWATSVDAVGRALGLFLRFIPADTNDPEPRREVLSRHDLATLRDLTDRWATRPTTGAYLTRSSFTDLRDIGALELTDGNTGLALRRLEQAAQAFWDLDDERCAAATLLQMGPVLAALADRERAIASLTEAAAFYRRHGLWDDEQRSLALIADLTPDTGPAPRMLAPAERAATS